MLAVPQMICCGTLSTEAQGLLGEGHHSNIMRSKGSMLRKGSLLCDAKSQEA